MRGSFISSSQSSVLLNLEDNLSTRIEKLGPINLDIKPGQRLYEAWDESFQNEV
jgi:hypothetical protein